MMSCDRPIPDYANLVRVLGRRADTRLASALRQQRPSLAERLSRALARPKPRPAPRQIRRWTGASFVARPLAA